MTNLFGLVSTDPAEVYAVEDPDRAGERSLHSPGSSRNRKVIAAWGALGGFENRCHAVLELLAGRDVMCLKETKEGYPIPLCMSRPILNRPNTEADCDRSGGEMNQKSNQSKEQLDSELLKLPPTKVLPEETLIALLQSGDSRGLEEAQKYIDDHIKKQCDAKGVDFWDYYLDPRYPEAPDNYNGYDQSVAIMAYNVVNCPQTGMARR